MNKKDRIHDWRKLIWPFCVSFSYYALLCLYTGSAEASEAGFLAVLIIALLIDAEHPPLDQSRSAPGPVELERSRPHDAPRWRREGLGREHRGAQAQVDAPGLHGHHMDARPASVLLDQRLLQQELAQRRHQQPPWRPC